MFGLGLHLARGARPTERTSSWVRRRGGPRASCAAAATGWGEADIAAGQDPRVARAAPTRTAGFYTGGRARRQS